MRDMHEDIKAHLESGEPFAYAHLVKFERPEADNMPNLLESLRYVYLTDASRDVVFDGQTYRARELDKVGSVSESASMKSSSMTLNMDTSALGLKETVVLTVEAGNIISGIDLISYGLDEGSVFTLSSLSEVNNGATVEVDYFISDTSAKVKLLGIGGEESTFTGSEELTPTTSTTYIIEGDIGGVSSLLNTTTNNFNYTSYINREVTIYRVYIVPDDGSIIGEPLVLFKGTIASANLSDSIAGTSKLSWVIADNWTDFTRVSGRVTNDSSYRGKSADGSFNPATLPREEYKSDLGFVHSDRSIKDMYTYQEAETRYKVKNSSSWLGLVNKAKLVEYEVMVDRDVDLQFSTSSKPLPVVYGVRRVDSFPIFLDVDRYDASKIYVAYAICEGEVEALYDIYFDGKSSVCTDLNDFNSRGAFEAIYTESGYGYKDIDNVPCWGVKRDGLVLAGERYYRDGFLLPTAQTTLPASLSGFYSITGNTEDFEIVSDNVPVYSPLSAPENSTTEVSYISKIAYSNVSTALKGTIDSGGYIDENSLWNGSKYEVPNNNDFIGLVTQSFAWGFAGESIFYKKAFAVSNTSEALLKDYRINTLLKIGFSSFLSATFTPLYGDSSGISNKGFLNTPPSNPSNGDYFVLDSTGYSYVYHEGYWYQREVDPWQPLPVYDTNSLEGALTGTIHRDFENFETTPVEGDLATRGYPFFLGTIEPDSHYCPYYYVYTDILKSSKITTGSAFNDYFSSLFDPGEFMAWVLVSRSLVETTFSGFGDAKPQGLNESGILHEHTTRFQYPLDMSFTFHSGKDNQTANGILCALASTDKFKLQSNLKLPGQSYWSANHRLLDTAYVVAAYDLKDGESNIPEVEFTVKGKKIDTYGFEDSFVVNTFYAGFVQLGSVFKFRAKTADTVPYYTYAVLSHKYSAPEFMGTNRAIYKFSSEQGINLSRDYVLDESQDLVIVCATRDVEEEYPGNKYSRFSLNPMLQLTDYLTDSKYGAGISKTSIDWGSVENAVRFCDDPGEVSFVVSNTSALNVGDLLGTPVTQGRLFFGRVSEIASIANSPSYSRVTLSNVTGKLISRYDAGAYNEDAAIDLEQRFIYYKGRVLDTKEIISVRNDTSSNYFNAYIRSILLNGDNYYGEVEGSYLSSIDDLIVYLDREYPDSIDPDISLYIYDTFNEEWNLSNQIKVEYSSDRLDGTGNPCIIRYLNDDYDDKIFSGYSLYDSSDIVNWRFAGWDNRYQSNVTRHQLSQVIDTSSSVFDNIASMLAHFGGILKYENGRYGITLKDYTSELSAIHTVSAEDIIGDLKFLNQGSKKLVNTVELSYTDNYNEFNSTNVTLYSSEYLSQDKNIPKKATLKSPSISNYFNARIRALQVLNESRLTEEISFTVGQHGIVYSVGDLINLVYPRFGWLETSNKLFKITGLTLRDDCLVDVVAVAHLDKAYDPTSIAAGAITLESSVNASGIDYSRESISWYPKDIQTTTDKVGYVTITWTHDSRFLESNTVVEVFRIETDDISGDSYVYLGSTVGTSYTDYLDIQQDVGYRYILRYKRTRIVDNNIVTAEGPYRPFGGLVGLALAPSSAVSVTTSRDTVSLQETSDGVYKLSASSVFVYVALDEEPLTYSQNEALPNTFSVAWEVVEGDTNFAFSADIYQIDLAAYKNPLVLPDVSSISESTVIKLTINVIDASGNTTSIDRLLSYTLLDLAEENLVMAVESSAGDTFRNGTGSTILKATLFRGTTEITNYTDYVFVWKRDGEPVYTTVINGQNSVEGSVPDGNPAPSTYTLTDELSSLGRSILVGPEDVNSKAQFTCDVYLYSEYFQI